MRIISNHWNDRVRVKTNANGRTSPLHVNRNFSFGISFSEEDEPLGLNKNRGFVNECDIPADNTDYESDAVLDAVGQRDIEKIVEEKKESSNPSERFAARVFYYSRFKYKNVRQFSRASKIPYRVCRFAYNGFLDNIRRSCR